MKRIHEYKRQLLNVLGIIWRYDQLKRMTPEQREQVRPASAPSTQLQCFSPSTSLHRVRGLLLEYLQGMDGFIQSVWLTKHLFLQSSYCQGRMHNRSLSCSNAYLRTNIIGLHPSLHRAHSPCTGGSEGVCGGRQGRSGI